MALCAMAAVILAALVLRGLTTQTPSQTGLVTSVSTTTSGSAQFSSAGGTTRPTGDAPGSYVTSSPLNSSQWLVLSEAARPAQVISNLSGTIPPYDSLASLNNTRIGSFCTSVKQDGSCANFVTLRETGWYYEPVKGLLYIHYVGGKAVKISVLMVASQSATSDSKVGG